MATDENTNSLRVASFSCYLSNPEENFVHKIGGAVEPIVISPPGIPFSVASVKPGKAAAAEPPLNSTKDNLGNLRVESFSSYLKTGEDNFVFKTSAAPVQDPTIAFVFPQQKQPTLTKSKDEEISIFGADKYFNMDLDYGAAPGLKYRGKLDERMVVDIPHPKPNLKSGTPSICSEVSSCKCNSQNALLQNLRPNGYPTEQKKTTRRRFFATFSCHGPCLNDKAVYVDESIGHGISQPGSKPGVRSPFVLSSGPCGTEVQKHWNDQSIEEQRKSLEVFGSNKIGKGDIAVNLERKLSVLTWDAIPKAQNLPTTTNGSSTVCDDLASDASSDLFEIENISSSGYGLVNTQTSGDYMSSSCMSPTTQYAPSEASIEWSVVTASAADYSSIISDYDEKNFGIGGDISSRTTANRTTKTKNPVGKEGQKTRPGGLLSCKSHKAVSVAETVHNTSEKAKQR